MKPMAIVGAIAGGLLLVGAVVVLTVIQYKNYAVRTENAIKAQHQQNKNNYSNFTNAVVEMLQVADVQKEAVKEVVQKTMEGRYGENGSKAMFQWLNENNIAYDQSAFAKVVNRIEGGRKDFEQNQKVLIDMVQVYKTNTDPDNIPKGMVLAALGFPRFNLDEMKIVTSDKTQETFATGIDNGMELAPKKK